MLRNMAISLIEHKRITTTLAKAKSLRKYIEPLVTKAKNADPNNKENYTHARRVVFSYLQNKEAIKELFDEVIEKVGNRPGGYTRILKIGNRPGDNAEMAFIEFVDFNEYAPGKVSEGSSSRRRRRRRRGKKGSGNAQSEAQQQSQQKAAEEADSQAAAAIEDAEVVEEMTEQPEATTQQQASTETAPKPTDETAADDQSDDKGSDEATDDKKDA